MSLRLRTLVLVLATAFALTACGEESPSPTTAPRPTSSGSGDDSLYEKVRTETGETVYTGERHVELDRDHPIEGRIVERSFGGWKRLNPITQRLPIEEKLLGFHLNLFLLEEHPEEIEPMPMLARSLPELADDAQLWTIRPEATWDDGAPVEASDAVATWQAIKAYSKTIARTVYESIGGDAILGVDALDARRFRVRHAANGKRAAQAFGLYFGICDARSLPADLETMDATRALPGSGPYRLKDERIRDEELILERKQPWWGDAVPAFKNRWRVAEYVYKVVGDSTQVEEQLRRGLVDIAALNGVERYVALTGEPWDRHFRKAHYYLSHFSFIGWNCGRAPFDDVRVRRALAHLVPRRRINEERYHGLSQSRSGPFFFKSIYSDPSIEPPRFSPKTALALLEEAGWKDRDGDGILDKDGKPFRFAMMRQNIGADWAVAVLDLYEEALKQVGIEMTIDVVDATNALYPRAARHDFDAYILIWSLDMLTPEKGARALYHSSQATGGFNWQDLRDEEVDRQLAAFDQDDEIKRVQAAHALHRRLHDLQPMTFLFTNPACVVWNRRLENVVPHALGVRPWDFRVAR